MALLNAVKIDYDANARYDTGGNAAGCGRSSNQSTLSTGAPSRVGLDSDGVQFYAHLRAGLNAAGVARSNGGPNVAGAPRSSLNG